MRFCILKVQEIGNNCLVSGYFEPLEEDDLEKEKLNELVEAINVWRKLTQVASIATVNYGTFLLKEVEVNTLFETLNIWSKDIGFKVSYHILDHTEYVGSNSKELLNKALKKRQLM